MKAADINKGVKIKSGSGNTEVLEKINLKITKSTVVDGGSNKVNHPLIKACDSDSAFLYVEAKIAEKPHMGQPVEFVGNILTRKGDIACYPGNDEIKPSLLWEIKEGIREANTGQLKDGWMKEWIPQDFVGKMIKFDIKYIISKSGEYYIPLTAYHREKDAKYREEQQKQDSYSNEPTVAENQAEKGSMDDAFKGVDDNEPNDQYEINPDDLPFKS